jgi:hypothetical protein
MENGAVPRGVSPSSTHGMVNRQVAATEPDFLRAWH